MAVRNHEMERIMAPKAKVKKMASGSISASQFFDVLATKTGLKKKVVKGVTYAMVDVITTNLLTVGIIKVPHLGRFFIKDIPAKNIPAGDYLNMFKKGADGKPVLEHREARVRPARRKIKVSLSSQVKKPLAMPELVK